MDEYNKCSCGSTEFDVLQTRRLKNARYMNGKVLDVEHAKGRNLEVVCSNCDARFNDDLTPFKGYYWMDGIEWGFSEEYPSGKELVTQSKDSVTHLLMQRLKAKI